MMVPGEKAPFFSVSSVVGRARAGELSTDRGSVLTPAFMPVATQGAVKAATHEEIETLGFNLIMANTYHLTVRPGLDAIRRLGGLHRFMGWPGMIATDSGGFQVMSLAHVRKVTDEGVVFRSPVDGTKYNFTPESVIAAQETFGSDFAMCLDVCPPARCTFEEAEIAVRRTTAWAKRSIKARLPAEPGSGRIGALFGIVQGAVNQDLRRRSVDEIQSLGFDGMAIGGLSVGEEKSATMDTLNFTTPLLAEDKPRYLMGVGEPGDVIEAVAAGVDLFDCVFPTRVARNGLALTRSGRVVVRNAAAAGNSGALDDACTCPACRRYGQAYLRHLIHAGEIAGLRLLTLHNLTFMRDLMSDIRAAIMDGSFESFRRERMAVWRAGATSFDTGSSTVVAGR